MDSDKYNTSNCAKLAPHIYDATAKGRSALLAKRLDPPLPGRKEDPARSHFPARDAQKQFT